LNSIKNEKGSITVESALVTPLILILVFLSVLLIINFYSLTVKNSRYLEKQDTIRDPAKVNRNVEFALEAGGEIIDEIKK
jgi:hypothetical protein